MDAAEAQARLERMTDAASEPALSAEDVADCLAMSRLVDADGLAPSEVAWTPTWDLNRGAAEGWRRKAGRLAMRFDFGADGQTFQRSQAVAHCECMAEQYRRRVVCSVPVVGTMARSDD
ncbi:MAG TPA: hypothetical protein PLJ35_15740 [Anaerolineae bacterium]|nr:hypothetical protein [Anaerolineae bacterium]HPL29304.1 hypothetical protein [Anaerolineae bacterium]